MMDIEKKRETMNTLEITQNFNIALFSLIFGQILINVMMDRRIGIFTTIVTTYIINHGLFRLTSTKDSMMEIYSDNIDRLLYSIIYIWLALSSTYFILHIYRQDMLIAMNQTVVVQEEIERVLEHLDEAIICRSKQGISFCNTVGFNILKNIQAILQYKETQTGMTQE